MDGKVKRWICGSKPIRAGQVGIVRTEILNWKNSHTGSLAHGVRGNLEGRTE